jgi:ribonuclease HI
MGVDVMRPAYNFEPKYRVTKLTKEDWTKGTGTPPVVKGLVWFTDGSKMQGGGTGAGVYGHSVRRRPSFSLGKYATVFQAEIYAILACAHEIKIHGIPEKQVSICSDSQAALKAIKAVRTTSLLVHQRQKTLNDISALHAMGLYWVPGPAGVRGNEIADGLARCGSASRFVGPEPALGISRQDLRNTINRWLVNQHWGQWQSLGNTQRQARELISGPCLGTKARLLSFNRIQSRAVTGFLTGHNNSFH